MIKRNADTFQPVASLPTLCALVEFEMIDGHIVSIKAEKIVCNCIVQSFAVNLNKTDFQNDVGVFLDLVGMNVVFIKNNLQKAIIALNEICYAVGADILPNSFFELSSVLLTNTDVPSIGYREYNKLLV